MVETAVGVIAEMPLYLGNRQCAPNPDLGEQIRKTSS